MQEPDRGRTYIVAGRDSLEQEARAHEISASELAETAEEFDRLGYSDYAELLRQMSREHIVQSLKRRAKAGAL